MPKGGYNKLTMDRTLNIIIKKHLMVNVRRALWFVAGGRGAF